MTWSGQIRSMVWPILNFTGTKYICDFGTFNGVYRNRIINSVFQHKKSCRGSLRSEGYTTLEMSPGPNLKG